jgi:hypothetical protein
MLSLFCAAVLGATLVATSQSPEATTIAALSGPVAGGTGRAFGALTTQDLIAPEFVDDIRRKLFS